MKRTYRAPAMTVERFVANMAVAACNRELVSESTTTTYNPVTLTCAIGGQNEVFYTSSTSGCNTSASDYLVSTYNGTTYFMWYTTSVTQGSTTPTSAQQDLMIAILNAGGRSVSTAQGWHYCVLTPDISTSVSQIYGYSY